MKRASLFVSLVAAALPPLAHGAVHGAAMGRDASLVTQLIVQPSSFHEAHAVRLDANAMAPFIHASGLALEHARPMSGQAQVLKLPHPMTVDEARAHAAKLVDAGVAISAEPDVRVYPSLVPNDSFYSYQWHYHRLVTGQVYGLNNYGLNLPAAWDITTGSSGVVVAVIDTGLLPHEDIDAGRVLPGYDFITDIFTANDGSARDPDPRDPGDWVTADEVSSICQPQDSSWHGTHIAATIGAASDNAFGVTGIDWQASLLPVRVLGKCGGEVSDVIDGLRWSAGLSVPGVPDNPQPARVMNMSFTGPGACGNLFQDAINDVRAKGAVLVVSAGNASASAANYFPGNCSGVINVTATDRQGQESYFSNTGSVVTLSAPGGGRVVDDMILSAWNTGETVPAEDSYAFAAGTSMAAAHVSGVASLMLSVNPSLGPDAVRDILRQTATPFPTYTSPDATGTNCTTTSCGAGIVRADWALLAAQGVDFVPDTFAFTAQQDVAVSVPVTSEAVVIGGLGHEAPISVSNGEYSVGCSDTFTRAGGVIANGQSVCVRHTSAPTSGTSETTVLTIGGVNGSFTSTTRASSGGGGGATGLLTLAGLAGLAAWRRRRASGGEIPSRSPLA